MRWTWRYTDEIGIMLDIRSNRPAGPERNPASALRIFMLGSFECRRSGQVIPNAVWRTRPTLTLLKFLLDERDRSVSADRLIDAVWPDANPEAARRSLQVAIRTLRLALEPDLKRGADSRYIRTEPNGYRFDSAGCSIDVDEFLAASQHALSGEGRHDLATAIESCRNAAALYRDDYLADDPYLEWCLSARERLRSRYLDILDLLSASLVSAGESEQAIVWIERALGLDPLREELHRRLMRCHLAQGRRSHALAAFERCRTILQAELGVEPAPETFEVRDEIARGGRLAEREIPGSYAVAIDLQLPFVGRGRELASLDRAAQRAKAAGGVLVAIAGPAGVGKTRLIQRFSEQIAAAPQPSGEPEHRQIWISSHETEQDVPFSPLIRLLASWFERGVASSERGRLGPHIPALTRLVPRAGVLSGGSAASGPAVELSQLLEAITQAVQIMFGTGPGLLIVDDAHWADASTALWLGYALGRLRPGILAVVNFRTSEQLLPEYVQMLADARRRGSLIDLPLTPLATGDLDDLLAGGIRDARERAGFSRRLHRNTGGLPLFVVETLRALLSSGTLYADEQGWWQIAASASAGDLLIESPGGAVREIIEARVSHLDPSTHDAFVSMCVLGSECRATLVAAATGLTLETTLGALDKLLERGLIKISSDRHGYLVEHPVVRQVVYDSLSPGRRQDWHRRVAGGLWEMTTGHPAAVAGQALHHLVAGDAPLMEIVEAARLAGEHAMQQSAFADAVQFLNLARERLGELLPDPVAGRQLAVVSELQADALAGAGHWDLATEAYEALLAARAAPLDRARTMRKLASVLGDVRGQFEGALDLLSRAEGELAQADDAGNDSQAIEIERGRIEAARSTANFFRSEYALAVTHGTRALEHWTGKDGVERDVIEQIVRLGTAAQRMGRLDQAEQHFRGATARAEMHGDGALEVRCRDNLGGLLSLRGRLIEARQIHQQTVAFGRDFGVPRLELAGQVNTANAYFQLGELERAIDAYEAALERAEALDARYTVMHALVGLGEALVRAGDHNRARRALQRGIELSEAIDSVQRRGHAYLHLAELALLEEDPESARDWAERGIASGSEIHDIHVVREGCPILAQALTALGRAAEAEHEARRGLEIAVRSGFRVSEGRNRLALGGVLAATDRLPDARSMLAEADSIFRDAGAGYDLAATRLALAQVAPDVEQQREHLRAARQLASALSARPLDRRIELALEALGER